MTKDEIKQFAEENGYEPFYIDGIEDGFCLIKQDINNGEGKFYEDQLLAMYPHRDDIVCYKPVIYSKDALPEDIKKEFERQIKTLSELYNKTLKEDKITKNV